MGRIVRLLRRAFAVAAPVVMLSGLVVLSAGSPAGADTTTFSSATIGASGTTPSFNQTGPWTLSWTYGSCTTAGNQPGEFEADVNQPNISLVFDEGPAEVGSGSSGVDYFYDTGQFSLDVESDCTWSITVAPSSIGALTAPATFTSAQTGQSGSPQEFSVSGPWTLLWSYSNCTAEVDNPNEFFASVNPIGNTDQGFTLDAGPDEVGDSGSGIDYFYDTGQFNLPVGSNCTWTMTVAPSAAATLSVPATFTSAQTGQSGSLQQFNVSGPWTLSYTYDCTAGNAQLGEPGLFDVGVNEPENDPNTDTGPLSFDATTGSGKDFYYDTGQFTLDVSSDCTWTLAVASSNAGALSTPATYTSAQLGQSGNPQEFSVASPWVMAWSYNCSSSSVFDIFAVGVNQPVGDPAVDTGPQEEGTGGSGTNNFNDTGTFSLSVLSGCDWTISITATGQTAPTPPPTPTGKQGYWLVGSDGGIFTFGSAQFHGSTGNIKLQRPVVGISPTADDGGYWLVASDGGVFSFGDAGFYGSIPGLGLAPAGSSATKRLNAPIVGIVPTADNGGYFMVASDGGVFAFGDANFEGSCHSIGGCSGAAVAVMPDATGNGYWLVTATGHVYAFGDATNFGQPGPESSAVTSAVRTVDGKGYWILFANGSVASFGDATNLGNPSGSLGTGNPATAIFTTSSGGGYWVATANGSVFNFGDAVNEGGESGSHLNGSIIAASGF